MEIRNLNTFIQAAESNSFTRAAKILGYTQSTVSFQIKQLEEEFGCTLFERINHRIILTDKGRLLLEYAENIMQATSELKESFTNDESPAGHVHIVTSDSICEMMMIRNYHDFFSEYPDIELEFSTANTNEMLDILDHNEADVIFTLDNHVYRQNYVIAKEEPVGLHFVTEASSPLAGKKDLSIYDMLKYPFMLTEKGMSYRKILDDKLAALSIELKPVLEIGRTDVLCCCIEGNNGISFLPDFVTRKAVEDGSLVYLDVKDFDLSIWKQLIYHKGKWLSKALTAFIEYVKVHEFPW